MLDFARDFLAVGRNECELAVDPITVTSLMPSSP